MAGETVIEKFVLLSSFDADGQEGALKTPPSHILSASVKYPNEGRRSSALNFVNYLP